MGAKELNLIALVTSNESAHATGRFQIHPSNTRST